MSSGLISSTVLFDFSEKNLAALIASCADDVLLPIVQAKLPLTTTILEAGAGSGRWVKALTDRGYTVTGIELNQADVARFRQSWPEIAFDHGTVESLPYPDAHFDAVLSLGVIEHLFHGPEQAMKQMHRVLKPHGTLLLTVPHANLSFILERLKDAVLHRLYASNALRRFLGKQPNSYAVAMVRQKLKAINRGRRPKLPIKYSFSPAAGRDFYEYRFTSRQIRQLAERAGFTVESIQILYAEERLYQIFGRVVGHYDGGQAPRLNPLGRWIAGLLPMAWIGHMVLIVARLPMAGTASACEPAKMGNSPVA